MRRNFVSAAAVAAVLAASPGWAVAKGGSLFIKCPTAKLQKDDKATAGTAASLKAGDEVKWQGAADKPYHKVVSGSTEGYVDASCLSPSKPVTEYATNGSAINAEAFKSSGAATKGLSQAAITYSNEKGQDKQRTAAQIIYIEENTKVRTEPNDKGFIEWAKKAGVNFAGGKVASK